LFLGDGSALKILVRSLTCLVHILASGGRKERGARVALVWSWGTDAMAAVFRSLRIELRRWSMVGLGSSSCRFDNLCAKRSQLALFVIHFGATGLLGMLRKELTISILLAI